VDGVLVEKDMATYESILGLILGSLLNAHLEKQPLGVVVGEDGQLRILPCKMRIPDVSFISWNRFPGRELPTDRVYEVVPDLAVEILSEGNTEGEMKLKLQEYFEAGVHLVWYINPRTKSARVFTAVDEVKTIDEHGVLEGEDVLPGFQLRLGELLSACPGRQVLKN
jgi:Uma2 family endonuclease